MQDDTEQFRRERCAELAAEATDRATLEARYGPVWNTAELMDRFEVIGFIAPFVVVKDRLSGKTGSLEFQHSPRFFFSWREDKH
jgi:hypothetical protein